ncbi:hypothetical protein AB1Y20_007295 [Prymnesium parvum]|uniref:Acid phosphatase n=1 Tax=Prymnesium parvum TaxID=97485 RepID=A0AB34IX80_PRYPA
MARQLVALVALIRHGQRAPYPPPDGDSAADPNKWSPRSFPGPAAWNMSAEAFAAQLLTPRGKQLQLHLGGYFASRLEGSACDSRVSLIADSSVRDVESATHFARGFFPPECASRVARLIVANASSDPPLLPVVNDHAFAGCAGPSASEVELSYGGQYDAMVQAYAPQIRRLSALIRCCSPALCASYAASPNCTLADLPHAYSGVYFDGFYTGPLAVAGYFSNAFMLQVLSDVAPYAWGEASLDELVELYQVHQRVMWLGAQLNSSRAYGSHTLAYMLASLEQIVSDAPLRGLADASLRPEGNASRQLLLALFGHDFNLLYARRLLEVSWVTDSWNFDAAVPGTSLVLELYLDGGEWHVVAALLAASVEQQREARPLVAPHEAPPRAVILDEPYARFKRRVLEAIDVECVLEPLRTTVRSMAAATPPAAGGWQGVGVDGLVGVVLGALLVGALAGVLLGRASNRQPSAARTPIIGDVATSSMAIDHKGRGQEGHDA